METKNISAKQVVSGTMTTTLNKINVDCTPMVEQLMGQLESQNIAPAGPLEFIYTGATDDKDKEFHLEIAQPVNLSNGEKVEGFEIKEIPNFKCASLIYKGHLDKMMEAYNILFGNIQQQALQPTNVIREVYENWVSQSSDQNIVDIQVGIN